MAVESTNTKQLVNSSLAHKSSVFGVYKTEYASESNLQDRTTIFSP